MSDKNANSSIKCSVTSCAYHCNEKNYCSLEEIKVGCCDPTVTDSADTECASFRMSGQRS
jgi:hypothetical protein